MINFNEIFLFLKYIIAQFEHFSSNFSFIVVHKQFTVMTVYVYKFYHSKIYIYKNRCYAEQAITMQMSSGIIKKKKQWNATTKKSNYICILIYMQ